MEQFLEGGWGMWVVLLAGVSGLVAAFRYARRGDARLRPVVESLMQATLYFALAGFATGVVATGNYLQTHDGVPFGPTLFQGVKESANNLGLGFTLLALQSVVMALGRRRETPLA